MLPAPFEIASKVPQASGYYVGISQNQVTVSLTTATTLSLQGLSPNVGALYKRALSTRLRVLFRGGYEGLAARVTCLRKLIREVTIAI